MLAKWWTSLKGIFYHDSHIMLLIFFANKENFSNYFFENVIFVGWAPQHLNVRIRIRVCFWKDMCQWMPFDISTVCSIFHFATIRYVCKLLINYIDRSLHFTIHKMYFDITNLLNLCNVQVNSLKWWLITVCNYCLYLLGVEKCIPCNLYNLRWLKSIRYCLRM